MSLSLEEYRRSLLRTVQAPSGLTYKVRILTSAVPLLKALKSHGLLEAESLDGVELAERTDSLLRELLPNLVVEPKLGEQLGWEEICDEDKLEIFRVAVEKLGFLRQGVWGESDSTRGGQSPPSGGRPPRGSLPQASKRGTSPAPMEAGARLGSPENTEGFKERGGKPNQADKAEEA
ncbi:MAG: hypothetical protein DRO52_05135 [Candidatus Hecatellales archaeon]|nr:MAG: hypothetical protein DRO52_05135 [Candidatus Hecatellales archaeon]